MKIQSTPFMLLALILTVSCNKDKVCCGPPPGLPDPSIPNTLTFQQVTSTEFLLWVGGEEMNTAGINPEDFDFDNHITSGQLNQFDLSFDADSVNLVYNNASRKFAYRFTNDSLYLIDSVEIAGENELIEKYAGKGNRYELRVEQNYLFGSLDIDGQRLRFGSPGFGWNSFANTSDVHGLDNPAQMQQSDSIMIFNQKILFE